MAKLKSCMIAIIIISIVIISTALVYVFYPSSFIRDYDASWEMFKVKHHRKFGKEEEYIRRSLWERSVQAIMKHNLEMDLGIHSYRLKVNRFSDLTAKELEYIKGYGNNFSVSKSEGELFSLNYHELPTSVDWRDKGYVTQVKDQGYCGSCWAFSATGSLEGQQMAKSGALISLSEQNLVDCSYKEGNAGCNGGYPTNAFQYVERNKGIDTEESYPYKGKTGKCKFNPQSIGATCTGFTRLQSGNETSLMTAVALIGPISVVIDASFNFMAYDSGIFYDSSCSATELNHAVLVVGYDKKNGTEYWIVKNSWGTDWGMNGYIFMSRNRNNNCGIASFASYPRL